MPEFRKYHGLGNDFLILRGGADALAKEEVRRLCRRHRGVGADGVLLVRPADVAGSIPQVEMVIYNRDGSRPQMCGNGVRCVAAFVSRHWELGPEIIVNSDAGPRHCQVEQIDRYRWSVAVQMGRPSAARATGSLADDDRIYDYLEVDMGNPHAVIFGQPSRDIMRRLGEKANQGHAAFPEGVNLEFVAPTERGDTYSVVVYERGVGFTQACGTGACAAAQAIWEKGEQPRSTALTIELPGGPLRISTGDREITMTGGAVEVFCGTWLD